MKLSTFVSFSLFWSSASAFSPDPRAPKTQHNAGLSYSNYPWNTQDMVAPDVENVSTQEVDAIEDSPFYQPKSPPVNQKSSSQNERRAVTIDPFSGARVTYHQASSWRRGRSMFDQMNQATASPQRIASVETATFSPSIEVVPASTASMESTTTEPTRITAPATNKSPSKPAPPKAAASPKATDKPVASNSHPTVKVGTSTPFVKTLTPMEKKYTNQQPAPASVLPNMVVSSKIPNTKVASTKPVSKKPVSSAVNKPAASTRTDKPSITTDTPTANKKASTTTDMPSTTTSTPTVNKVPSKPLPAKPTALRKVTYTPVARKSGPTVTVGTLSSIKTLTPMERKYSQQEPAPSEVLPTMFVYDREASTKVASTKPVSKKPVSAAAKPAASTAKPVAVVKVTPKPVKTAKVSPKPVDTASTKVTPKPAASTPKPAAAAKVTPKPFVKKTLPTSGKYFPRRTLTPLERKYASTQEA